MQYRTISALATAIVLVASVLFIGGMQKSFAAPSIDVSKSKDTITQRVFNDGTVESIDLWIKKKTAKTQGEVILQVLQEGKVVSENTINANTLPKKFAKVTLDLDASVSGDFDLKVSFEGKGGIKVQREKASKLSFDGQLIGKKTPKGWNLKLSFNGGSSPASDNNEPPGQTPGQITVYAYRIASEHWAPTFKKASAAMYFVVYNSDGELIYKDFANEDGTAISGLQSGSTYWIYPTDCEDCHGGDHDVRFHHWENGSVERPRPVVATESGVSVGAYYEFVPPSGS